MKKMKKTAMLCISFTLIFSMAFTALTVCAEGENTSSAKTDSSVASSSENKSTDNKKTEKKDLSEVVAGINIPAPSFELIAQTDKVALYADKKIGEIKFVDKVNGCEWYSNPQDKTSSIDIGENKERLYSQFSIEFGQAYNLLTTNSSIDCLKYTRNQSKPSLSTKAFNRLSGFNENAGHENLAMCESLSYELVNGGIKFKYTMPKYDFKIVLQYVVKDDYLEASILTNESKLRT
ncbi:MAG: hypothetical protein Q8873_04755, partial [Bacillota bacterium]|nr:hypothetical protein [Bacillota bacterium]